MKIQFKHQSFQAEAARAVCEVFQGQPRGIQRYSVVEASSSELPGTQVGWSNASIVLGGEEMLKNLRAVQLGQGLKPSEKLEASDSCALNLTVEMETGVGKTYTYIKTIFALNEAYGWSKFIVVVPSVAIREGVCKTFQITQDHFAEDYGRKIRFFIYNSSNLAEIRHFAQDSGINVMIINAQAFNARGKDARRIGMQLDSFGARRPIDVLAATNPILIIDEPQSVEGSATRENLAKFRPLLTLRYSATHRPDAVYNMVYRLDAQDAYNRRLVKQIEVKGFRQCGTGAGGGYIYVESVNISASAPTVTLEFDYKGKNGVRRKRRLFREGDNLYTASNGLEEYRRGYVVSRIDGRDGHVELVNGRKLYCGEVLGGEDEDQLRRLQIRETILSHLQREEANFYRGIKTLSLFFIDEVAKYRRYGQENEATDGIYAQMFEEEYDRLLADGAVTAQWRPEYAAWVRQRPAACAHAGYFSVDKKRRRYVGSDGRRGQSEDVDAYDLIMKHRERLLSLDEPVRFLFSHSALREGWDNPNVFQICTLKQSGSEVRKRQEVGRGLRLCVNWAGERMDAERLGSEADGVNVLTVIASESYEDFARALQQELASAVAERPLLVDCSLFEGRELVNGRGARLEMSGELALELTEELARRGYVAAGKLTAKYWEARENGAVQLPEAAAPFGDAVLQLLDNVYNPNVLTPVNARTRTVTPRLNEEKLASAAFQHLWCRINGQSTYMVQFDEGELVAKAVKALNERLRVEKIYYTVEQGRLGAITSRAQLAAGEAFGRLGAKAESPGVLRPSTVKYDLLGKIVVETNLTRATAAAILKGIASDVFAQFQANPEDFIVKASQIINEEKASVILQHITYNKLNSTYASNIFTAPEVRGQLGKNAMAAKKHLYDHVIYDSANERRFAEALERHEEVEIYVKLPKKFYISTPVGKYNPDWAIAFREGAVKHVYFVAETKGSLDSLQLRAIEKAKADCAKAHFAAISSEEVKYGVVSSYEALMRLLR